MILFFYPGHSFAIMLPVIVEESFNYLHNLIYDLVECAWPWCLYTLQERIRMGDLSKSV